MGVHAVKYQTTDYQGEYPEGGYRGWNGPIYRYRNGDEFKGAVAGWDESQRIYVKDRIRKGFARLYIKGKREGVMFACYFLGVKLNS